MPQDIPCKPYFDSILLFCLLKEFKHLEGKKVKALMRTGEHTIALCFAHETLLMSTDPVLFRTHLVSCLPKNLVQHPFDSHVKSRRVAEVKQLGLDRIFTLGFSKSGIHPSCSLVCELIGPSSNLFLIDEQSTIIASHRTSKTRRKGDAYKLGGRVFDELTRLSAEATLIDIIEEKQLKEAIRHKLKKIPLWLEEMMNTMDEGTFRNKLRASLRQPEPHIHYEGANPCAVSPLRVSAHSKPCSTFSAAIAELYQHLLDEHIRAGIKREMTRKLSNCRKIQRKLGMDQATADKSDEFRKMGELILLHIKDIKKGTKMLTLPDPYVEHHTVEIALDPARSAARNAAEYFRKARKAERSKDTIKRRKRQITDEISRLSALIDSLDDLPAETLSQMHESSRKIAQEKEASKPFKEFKTRSGKKILVGRSKEENEYLTFDVAKPQDIFFHVREAPGSHTILINDGNLSPSDIQEAAAIAAHFSRAKHASIVSVSYTQRRFVRRSKKLGPGKVLISREKTVFVEPTLPPKKHNT